MAPQIPVTQQTGTKPDAPGLDSPKSAKLYITRNCGGPRLQKEAAGRQVTLGQKITVLDFFTWAHRL